MRSIAAAVIAVLAGLAATVAAHAQETVKIGLIMPFSGQFADTAVQMDNGIKLYMQRNGDRVAGRKVELLRRDTGGVAPDVAKRLAQELVVRDGVDILAGFVLTPNAIAAADVSAEAKKLMVIMNAGTSIITTKSPYSTRTSVTLPQVSEAFGRWAAKSGIRSVYSMVSDFGPGHDAEQSFQRTFKEAGGEVVASVRFPVANPDFSAFVQRAKDINPEALFLFMPAGAQPAAFAKALTERGLSPKTIKILGTGEVTAESALKGMGEAALGIVTAWNYDYFQDTGSNKAFVKDYAVAFGAIPTSSRSAAGTACT
jgi:branched-chain amino acid transport system substrate-binding protein